jgi:hypothetical protein
MLERFMNRQRECPNVDLQREEELNAERDATIVLEAFDTLSNKRDYTAAEWF